MVVPAPSWLSVPAPLIAEVIVVASLWLKLIAPVPAPKAMVGVMIVPPVSLVPRRPMFKVPEETFDAAMTMFEAATVPPSATVRVLPLPLRPT